MSADVTNPARVGFDDDGSTLIVTERLTNRVDSYAVGRDGRLSGPASIPSAGPTPFAIGDDGALSARPSLTGTPAGLAGLAAF